jgi:hypothetical protein
MKPNGAKTLSVIAALCAGSFFALWAPHVSAQPPRVVTTPGFGRLPDAAIAQFKANPHSLLTTYASAGLPLSTQARDLVLTDPKLVDALIDLARSANDAQKGAIGAGLAEAARVLSASDPAEAARIRQAVAGSGLAPLITAFTALADSTIFAATDGGAAGSGGPIGGVGGAAGASGGGSPGGFSFGQTNGASPFGSIGGGGAPGGGLTSSTSQSVSPSKSSI